MINQWKNFREEHEPLSGLKEDKVMELQEMISTWIFKVIIQNPKDIEFKIRPWYEYVSVFNKWEFVCYITKEQWMWFADDNSSFNEHFRSEKTEEDEQSPKPDTIAKQLDLEFID